MTKVTSMAKVTYTKVVTSVTKVYNVMSIMKSKYMIEVTSMTKVIYMTIIMSIMKDI